MTAVVALLGFCTPAMAANWVEVTKSETGSVLEVDTESLVKSGNYAQVWVQIDHSKNPSTEARRTKELWKYDCQHRKSFTVAWVDFGPNGAVISSGNPQEYDFKYEVVVPDSVGETVMKYACDF